MDKSHTIVCRCEDVTLQDIHDLLDQGYTSFEDMKRLCRIGMGPCQANTCGHLAQREIARHLNVPVESVPVHKVRPLIMGVPLKALTEDDVHES